ncbi:MAG TPA: hypothetical protein VM575_05690 [Nocardioides sp.]|nr:hypothetical protein [Nocardioides sp.]
MAGSAVRNGIIIAVMALCASGCWSSTDEEPPRGTQEPVSGTTLEFGESATVPLGDGAGTVRVTVTELVEGDPADLRRYLRRNAKPGDQAVDGDPYYVRYELTSSSASARAINVTRLITVRAGDKLMRHLALTRPFAPCQEELWPFADAGGAEATVTGCSVWLRDPGGAEVDTAVANGEDADGRFWVQWTE